MTIDELMARVKAELPEDWEIHIVASRGLATVFLEDPNGDEAEFWGRHEEEKNGVEATVLAALAEAVQEDSTYEDCEEDDDE